MNKSLCCAIAKTGNPCGNRAKFGNFCGCHQIDKLICQGFTKCNERCKLTIKYGEFCSLHLHSEIPDNKQFAVYAPDVDWPEILPKYHEGIHCFVRKFNSGKDLDKYINKFSLYNFEKNHRIMILAEIFFRNFYLDFNTPHWQNIITEIQRYLKEFPFMEKYREIFRRKFDQAYRIETRNNCAETVLKKIFGNDISEIIKTKLNLI